MSDILWGRAIRLTLGTVQIQALDTTEDVLAIDGKVTKNLKGEANKVEIKVWNLASDTRKALETPKAVTTRIDIGYQREPHTIFLGQLRNAITERDGADIVTTISSGDSEDAFRFGQNLVTVPKNTTPADLLKYAAQGLQQAGVGVGNLKTAQGLASAAFGPATTLRGNAADVLDRVTRANGMEWSVQDGVLQILKVGASVGGAVVELSEESGLIGAPSVDTKGILKCKALIQPGLDPGRDVVMKSEFVKGAYRIEEAEYTFQTWADEWAVEITARKWPKAA